MVKTIVLVEDDEAIRNSFSLMLDKTRYNLKAYSDGRLIIKKELEAPDIFILDKNISGVDGLDLCGLIKHDSKYLHVPVIMLSATPDIVKLAKAAGADDALEKPFPLKKIKEMIERYVS
ncbi:MAG: response regulator [Chitinophagaceae bacterium]|nr:response regulator [Chitinophagaceae bacterium]